MRLTYLALLVILCSIQISNAQSRFRLNDASKSFDVELDVGNCIHEVGGICGPLAVSFLRKRARLRFQTIRLPRTNMWDAVPKANITRRYDDQSIINFGDFNFDGTDDVAVCDGTDGGYGAPSYRVYLYSRSKKRFFFSRAFTRMNYGGLGMFETNKKKKMHYVFTKSGCCWHQTQGFDVLRGRPRKVYEFTEEARYGDSSEVEITTMKLIRGRWRTWIKHVKWSEYYK